LAANISGIGPDIENWRRLDPQQSLGV